MTVTYVFNAKQLEIIYLQLARLYQQFLVKMTNYYLYRPRMFDSPKGYKAKQ